MLDTNICIFIMKQRAEVLARLMHCAVGDVGISTISVAELRFGAARSALVDDNHLALDELLIPLRILDFDEKAARIYGDVRHHLRQAGTPIGPLDVLIGAHALSTGAILVTNNTREFVRVPGLTLEDWTLQK